MFSLFFRTGYVHCLQTYLNTYSSDETAKGGTELLLSLVSSLTVITRSEIRMISPPKISF